MGATGSRRDLPTGGWQDDQPLDREDNTEGAPTPWWSRERAAQACEHLAVGLETASLMGPVLTGGSPAIYMTTGLLGIGLHFAAGKLRKR